MPGCGFYYERRKMSTYQVSQNAITLTGTTAKSLIEIVPPATGDAKIKEIGVWFKGVTTSDVPVLVEYGVDIAGGATATGTQITAANIAKWGAAHASQNSAATVKHTITVEGTWAPSSTSADPYVSMYVSCLGGYEVFFPLGDEMYVPPSAIFRLKLTPTQTLTSGVAYSVRWEE
jgi:hypothetical protein